MIQTIKSWFTVPLFALLISCETPKTNEATNINLTENPNPANGDLNKTFSDSNSHPNTDSNNTPESQFEIKKQELLAAGWSEEEIQNGQFPSCYNYKPKKGKYNNYLEISVGGGTDVALKIMNKETEKCVRYVFVNRNTTYRVKKIPEGIYYLKIAYGKNWLSKVVGGSCRGKFIRNPLYEKGVDELDFNVRREFEGISVPSFSLQLDVVSTTASNSFNSANISEDDFNE
jgi:hypothetical protein